jgi:outer membrane protein
MKKIALSLAVAVTLTSHLHADFLGFEVGAAYWGAKTTGDLQYNGSSIDLEQNLGYGDNMNTNFIWASFEHFVPLIPNIKIQHTKVDDSSNKNSGAVTFDNKVYSGDISSNLKLNQTDFILYYELLDNWVSLDAGLNFKYIDSSLSLNSAAQTTSTKDLKFVVPMVYAKAKFELPTTNFSIESDLSYIGYSGNQFYDFKAGLVYETDIGLGVTAGYRAEKLELDDIKDVYSDIKIDGAYAGIFYHF